MGWKPFKKPFGNRNSFVRKTLRGAGSIAGAAAGTALLGPVGGVIGGGLAGGMRGGNIGKNAFFGAGQGLLFNALAPTLTGAFGAAPSGIFGKMSGLGAPSLLHQLGMSSAPSFGGGLGLLGNAGATGLLGGKFGLGSMGFAGKLGKAALPEILGLLKGKQGDTGHGDYDEEYQSPGITEEWEDGEPHRGKPIHAGNDESSSLKKMLLENFVIDPNDPTSTALEKLSRFLEMIGHKEHKTNSNAIPQPQNKWRNPNIFRTKFKDGGCVEGDSGGQDDDVPVKLRDGSYVMDATTVSLLGDGSTKNGFKKTKQLEDSFLKSGIFSENDDGRNVKYIEAKVSPGEYIIEKKVVDNIGRGNNRKGAKELDKFRNNLRKHKGVGKFLPPKSKPLGQYFNSKAVNYA